MQGLSIRVLAATAERVLWLADRQAIITRIRPVGTTIAIDSYVLGLERPLAVWNPWNLHIYIVVSLALVLAVPVRSGVERLRLVVNTLGFVGLVGLLICIVQVMSATQAQALSNLGVRVYTQRQVALLDRSNQVLIMVGMLLVPASVFLMSYLSFWTSAESEGDGARRSFPVAGRRSRERTTWRRRWGVWCLLVVVIVASGALVTAEPPGSDDHLKGLRRLQERNPASARARLSLGIFQEEQGDLVEAAEAYRAALAIDGGFAAARYGLGNVSFKQGAFVEAEMAYRETLRLDPAHVGSRQNLGIALAEQGRFAEAVDVFSEVLRQNPRHAAAHHDLGVALINLGQPCEALPHLRWAASLDRRFARDPAVQGEILRLTPTCPKT